MQKWLHLDIKAVPNSDGSEVLGERQRLKDDSHKHTNTAGLPESRDAVEMVNIDCWLIAD